MQKIRLRYEIYLKKTLMTCNEKLTMNMIHCMNLQKHQHYRFYQGGLVKYQLDQRQQFQP